MSRREPVLLGAALLLIAFNLRLPLTAVPPLLDDVRAALGLSNTAAGLLTALPVLCFALAASAGPGLARRFGSETVLLGCMVVVAGGTAIRIVPEVGPLFAGTVVLGVGIAVANVLLPATIKRDFARPGLMMGLYTMVLNAGAAVGAAVAVPLALALGDWRWAMAAGGLVAVLAAVLWLPAVRTARRAEAGAPPPPRVSLWHDPIAWQLTLAMGVQSTVFFSSVAWLPDVLRDAGLSSSTAGVMLGIFALLGLPSSMVAPIVATRVGDQRLLVVATAALMASGLLGVLLSPATATVVWMVLMGLGQGAAIALVLTIILLRSPDGAHAAALSGMMQSGGYLIAATGPVIIGALHELTGGWTVPLLTLIGCAGAFAVLGALAGRARLVRGRSTGTEQWAY